MSLRKPPLGSLADILIKRATLTPYFHLRGYQQRYWVTPNPKDAVEQKLSARVHVYQSADVDRHLHDHPAESISVVLSGYFVERMPESQDQSPELDDTLFEDFVRRPGDVIYRRATDRHKIVEISTTEQTATMFIMGPWVQDWGFYAPGGKVYWREYLNEWGTDPQPGAVVNGRDASFATSQLSE